MVARLCLHGRRAQLHLAVGLLRGLIEADANDTNPSPPSRAACANVFACNSCCRGGYIMAISLGILPYRSRGVHSARLVVLRLELSSVHWWTKSSALQGSFRPRRQQTGLYKWLEFFHPGRFPAALPGSCVDRGSGAASAPSSQTSLGQVTNQQR